MYSLWLIVTFSFWLSLIVQLIFLNTSKKSWVSFNKLSPFECGFNSFKKNQLSMTIQFFIMSIVFLIFDMELLFLFPSMFKMADLMMYFGLGMFLLFLSLTFSLEWKQKILEWLK